MSGDCMNTTSLSACHWDTEAGQEEEYITLHGPFYSTHIKIYNLLIAQVHGRYRVFDAEVVGSWTRGRGIEGGVGGGRRRDIGAGTDGGGTDGESGEQAEVK